MQSSGADGASTPSDVAGRAQGRETARVAAPVKCPAAKRAVRFYAARVEFWRDKMGAPGVQLNAIGHVFRPPKSRCPRYLARILQRKAQGLRKLWAHHWDYRSWMPAHWIRLAICEERLNWTFSGGNYEGAFAFYTGTWNQYRRSSDPPRAYLATPRQQYEVALSIARKLTIGTPWGCWRGPQHAWVRGGLPERGFYG